jgi:hypothetical protein
MAIYYFDLRDGEELIVDDEGMELRDMRAVHEEGRPINDGRGSRCSSEPVCRLARPNFN